MISEVEALDRILAAIEPLPAAFVPVEQAGGLFAAEPSRSSVALPRFDQSAVDGYALRAADAPGTLRLVGAQPAGIARTLSVGRSEAVRIFTGAPLPAGADAVVMQEEVVAGDAGPRVPRTVSAGECIRRRGGDVCEGQELVAAGEPLTPPRIGLLCAAGVTGLLAGRRPRIAIITTGNEVRPCGSALAPGEIHDSNGPMLAAQLTAAADIVGVAHTPDEPSALAKTIQRFAEADAIILSAGVSVGDHDPVHAALRGLKATADFWRIAIKPGKPFLFARHGAQLIFGLPGNPVSTFVTAHLFILPALRRLAGAGLSDCRAFSFPVPLGVAIENPGPRPHYVRAIFRDGVAFPTPLQQSHALSGLAAADLLVRIDSSSTAQAGDTVPAFPINFR